MLDYCKAHHTQRGTHKKFFLVNFFVAIKRGRGFTASFFRVKLQLALVLERNAKKSCLVNYGGDILKKNQSIIMIV